MSSLGLFQPLPIPEWTEEDISVDFITRLPSYMVVRSFLWWDCLFKYTYLLALKHPFPEKSVA